jgi:hypothetical protein
MTSMYPTKGQAAQGSRTLEMKQCLAGLESDVAQTGSLPYRGLAIRKPFA